MPGDYDVPNLMQTDRQRTLYEPGGDWPSGLILEQNIIEPGWHQTEFQLRTSFVYTVVSEPLAHKKILVRDRV